ncbi:hypothetical protein [Neolewinella antarctica]|uniref:Uncharacterized protein n=1 Tax=Neolewinella antarctica TaxID=442734 RepID=A0ABX0XB05_9BACT|nr:hypothetical protein [Neolewinella antarctica]NJC26425.1 hypothetical protein [Neolewinella antarctica]
MLANKEKTDPFVEAKSIFGEDRSGYVHFLRLVVDDLTNVHGEFDTFIEDSSIDRYRGIRHNTLTTTRLFKLTEFNQLLQSGLDKARAGLFTELNETDIPAMQRLIENFREVVRAEIVTSSNKGQ